MKIDERIQNIGIVPVVKIHALEDTLPLANALLEGGIDVAEITYRSEFASDAIALIHKELPNMLVGAGTVLSVEQASDAVNAGARFIITPGLNIDVITWCLQHDVPIFPGVSSASELEIALSNGITTVKFFPAESSGGAKKLKDLLAPYPHVKFIPTGGINEKNIHEYLSLPNVLAIGGSFMLPNDALQEKDWGKIQQLSKHAIKHMLGFELIHLGINSSDSEESLRTAKLLCELFDFTYYKKPKSNFAGKGFEVLHGKGKGEHGHIAIFTPYPNKALYQLSKKGIQAIQESITCNKQTQLINFAYLDLEIAGFGIHLINPDVKM